MTYKSVTNQFLLSDTQTFLKHLVPLLALIFKSEQKPIKILKQNAFSLGAMVSVSKAAFAGSEDIALPSSYLQPHKSP